MDMARGKDPEAISHKQINPILGIVPAPRNGSVLPQAHRNDGSVTAPPDPVPNY